MGIIQVLTYPYFLIDQTPFTYRVAVLFQLEREAPQLDEVMVIEKRTFCWARTWIKAVVNVFKIVTIAEPDLTSTSKVIGESLQELPIDRKLTAIRFAVGKERRNCPNGRESKLTSQMEIWFIAQYMVKRYMIT